MHTPLSGLICHQEHFGTNPVKHNVAGHLRAKTSHLTRLGFTSIPLRMARFIPEKDHSTWTNLHTNWASNDSSSDNRSVYKYGQTDGSSVQTSYLDSLSMKTNYPLPDNLSGRMIRLFVCIYTQTNHQTSYGCLPN